MHCAQAGSLSGEMLLQDEMHVVFDCSRPDIVALRASLGQGFVECSVGKDLKRLFSVVDSMALGSYFFELAKLFRGPIGSLPGSGL